MHMGREKVETIGHLGNDNMGMFWNKDANVMPDFISPSFIHPSNLYLAVSTKWKTLLVCLGKKKKKGVNLPGINGESFQGDC